MTIEEYMQSVAAEKREAFAALLQTIRENLPSGFEETIIYNMPGFVVPKHRYPDGYHVDPKLPLLFINVAVQKNFISLYHLGLYAHQELLDWFVEAYPKHSKTKLDMGKSCIRFKKMDDIPLALVGELVGKISVEDWITLYQSNLKQQQRK